MSAAMRHSLTSRLAAKARAEAEALAAEVSRRKKITAAMEEAKKAAAKRREEALERLAKEEADLAKATKASLSTADAGPDAMDPGARASTDPAPARPAPGAAATEDKWPPLPRPVAKSEARGRAERQPRQRSKSAANKTGDTDTSLWSDIFANCDVHLRARRGALQERGVQPPSASFCRGTRFELFGRTGPGEC